MISHSKILYQFSRSLVYYEYCKCDYISVTGSTFINEKKKIGVFLFFFATVFDIW